jgi:hypothetical protein
MRAVVQSSPGSSHTKVTYSSFGPKFSVIANRIMFLQPFRCCHRKGSFVPLSAAAAIIIKVLWNLCPPPCCPFFKVLLYLCSPPPRHHHKGSFEPLPAALLPIFKGSFYLCARRRRHHHQGSFEPLPAALLPIFKGSFVPLSAAAAIIIKVLWNLCPPPCCPFLKVLLYLGCPPPRYF